MIDFADVDDLVDLLRATELRSVDVDPGKVNAPGVLVRVDGFTEDLLTGTTIKLNLILISPDTDARRALTQLQTLYTQTVPVLHELGGPTGDITTGSILLPGSAGPLPALLVPLDLLTTPTEGNGP